MNAKSYEIDCATVTHDCLMHSVYPSPNEDI
jgi:hypothetical protein